MDVTLPRHREKSCPSIRCFFEDHGAFPIGSARHARDQGAGWSAARPPGRYLQVILEMLPGPSHQKIRFTLDRIHRRDCLAGARVLSAGGPAAWLWRSPSRTAIRASISPRRSARVLMRSPWGCFPHFISPIVRTVSGGDDSILTWFFNMLADFWSSPACQ